MVQRTPGSAFTRLIEIVARLRAPGGCPWDREQTHATLRTHLLEETYETLDAIDEGDDAHLREELGDLLMQPVMHAQIAEEENRFNIVDVLDEISDKLVRRHPHVFGEITVSDSGEVLRNWDAIKKQEAGSRRQTAGNATQEADSALRTPHSALDDVPRTLPSLLLALKVSKKAAKVGFEWPDIQSVMDKLREETDELEADLDDTQRAGEELGDLLFTAVNVARWKKIDPEIALRETVARFQKRFAHMEAVAAAREIELQSLSPQQWDELWNAAKEK